MMTSKKVNHTDDLHVWYIRLLEVWGVIWGLPVHLFGLLVIVLLVATRNADVKRVQWPFIDVVMVKNRGLFGVWLSKKWSSWAGFNCGMVSVYRWDYVDHPRTIRHERRHGYQIFVFGLLQPVIYFLSSVWIYFFMKKLHSYYDNPFERDARAFAGQQVDIPKSQWMSGPADRWAWW